MKPSAVTLLVILAALGGYFVNEIISSGPILLPNVAQHNQSAVPTTPDVGQQTPPQPAEKNVGDTFTLWNMQYQVLSAVNEGSSYAFQQTTGKYILVKIKATNMTKTEMPLTSIILVDSEGRQYQVDALLIDISSGLDMYEITNDYVGIPPGFSESFIAPFEVPKDSTGLQLEFPSAQGPIVLSVNLGL
ncbi:MAG: hypothetical protein ABR881_32420 [Candidatus Sulfotelmatobacter sp.]